MERAGPAVTGRDGGKVAGFLARLARFPSFLRLHDWPWWQRDNTPVALRGCLLEHLHDSIQVVVVPAVQAFRTRCDQAVAQDAATQASVRQLEQAYDATGDETPRPRRDDDFNPEQLMHELEDFLRQERDRGTE